MHDKNTHVEELKRKVRQLEEQVAELEKEKVGGYVDSPSDLRHYRAINESSNNVFYKYDLIADHYEYISPSVFLQTGFTVEEFSAMKISQVMARVHPEDVSELESQMEDAGQEDAKNSVRMWKYRWRVKDGHYVWFEVNRSIVCNDAGVAVAIVGVVFDIGHQKMVENQLRHSKEYLQAILSSLHETVIAVYDRSGVHKFITIPAELEERYGITSEQVMGRSISDMYPPEVSERVVGGIERIFDTAEPITSQAEISLPKGKFVHEVTLTPMLGVNGGVRAVVAFIRDVTKEARAEKQLKKQRDAEILISNISTHFLNLSDEQTDLGMNQALKVLGEFTGVDRVNIFQICDEDSFVRQTHQWQRTSVPPYPEHLMTYAAEQLPLFSELIMGYNTVNIASIDDLPVQAESEKQFLREISVKSLVAIPLVYNRHVMGCMRLEMVTEERSWSRETINLVKLIAEIFVNTMMRKRSQQQLAEYQHKMFRAEQLASLGTISATVAHELNQPLTVMRLFLQQNLRALSQPDADHAKISESIEETLEEISNAESIVNRFRKFARKSSPTNVTQVNLPETAERVVASLAESARKAKLEIEVEFDDVAAISGNAAEFEQVFFVLIQNAIQASVPFKDQHLKIKAAQSESHVMITFSDDCGGVAEEHAEKIFEPFFTTKPETGTGLGLCILDRIIKRYRGELKIENISGQGITFNIKLPIDV